MCAYFLCASRILDSYVHPDTEVTAEREIQLLLDYF